MPKEHDAWLNERYKVQSKFCDAFCEGQDTAETVIEPDQKSVIADSNQLRKATQDEWDLHYDALGMS